MIFFFPLLVFPFSRHCENQFCCATITAKMTERRNLQEKNQPGSVAPSTFSVLNLLASIAPEIVYHFLVKPLAVAFPFGSVAFS